MITGNHNKMRSYKKPRKNKNETQNTKAVIKMSSEVTTDFNKHCLH